MKVILAKKNISDEAFLRCLFIEDMKNKFLDLPKKQREMIIELQYSAKNQRYLVDWPMANIYVVQYNGKNIGQLILAAVKRRLRIVDILLLPQFRNKGIGTQIFYHLINHKRGDFSQLELSVTKDNPAFELYKKIGFTIKSENEIFIEMVMSLT